MRNVSWGVEIAIEIFTWMMKMMMGFFGSYLLGLEPPMMPSWLAALEAAVVAAGLAVIVAVTVEMTVLAVTVEMTVLAIVRTFSFRKGGAEGWNCGCSMLTAMPDPSQQRGGVRSYQCQMEFRGRLSLKLGSESPTHDAAWRRRMSNQLRGMKLVQRSRILHGATGFIKSVEGVGWAV